MSEKYLKLIDFLSDIDNNIKVYTYEQYGTDFIFYEVLYKDIQKFKNTPKYKRLLSYVNDNNYNYSVKEMNVLLAHAVTIDDTIYRSRENLILYYETYPELFYIFETAKELYAVKYLLFIDNRYENLVENVLLERDIQFKKNSLHCSKQDLIVYIFVEKYDNYYQMEKLLSSQETLAQTIYKILSKQKGVPSSLIGLYLNEHYGNIHILGKTDIFSENRRVSNSGIRDDLGNLFRSSWEANIARLFNLKGIPWTFEKLPPADGYLPDFFCNNKTVVEVKGFWDSDSLKKVNNYYKNNNEYNYLFVDADLYLEMNEKYKSVIDNWEDTSVSLLKEKLPVIGLAYVPDKSVFNEIKNGDKVALSREKDNKFDKNAIAVYSANNKKIGYISSDWALVYSQKLDIGMTFESRIVSIEKNKIVISVCRNNFEFKVLDAFLTSL